MPPLVVEHRSDRGSSRKTTQLLNEPPELTVLSEKPLTDDQALAGLEEFIATASQGGPFAPRDDIVVRLQVMQKAMIRDQELRRRKQERNQDEDAEKKKKKKRKKSG